MVEVIKELPTSWVFALACIAVVAFIVLLAAIVWAVLQGRELTLWPPKVGPRLSTGERPNKTEHSDELKRFCERVVGHWWSLRDWEATSVGFVTITPYEPTATVRVVGVAYNANGHRGGQWESEACCLNPKDGKLYYYWTGHRPSSDEAKSSAKMEGFCVLTFRGPDHADGRFLDTHIGAEESTKDRTFRLKRCPKKEAEIMKQPDEALIGSIVKRELGQTTGRSAKD